MFFKEEHKCALMYVLCVCSTQHLILCDTNIYFAMVKYSHSIISIERECSIPQMDTYLNAYPRKDTFKVGDVLKFSCSQGRIMVGADSVQCYHFGWSPRLPACKGKYLSDSCWSKSWDFRYQPFSFPPLIFCPLSVHL